jgi:GT2 family glycosyltransferase
MAAPARTTRPDISVVICAYTQERWDDLVAAVESIARQSLPARDVVVVIDHNPRLLARVRAELPGVTAVPNRQARGLSGARNTGVGAARGEAIAFLDDDAEAAPDWLERLAAWFEDESVAGVGAWVEPNWECRPPAWFPREFNWVVGCSYTGLPEKSSPVRNLFGGCMCLRREVFDLVGGFHTAIGRIGGRPLGCEETELCIRLRQRRPEWRLVYEPRARIYHRVPAQRAAWEYFRARCYAEGLSKARMSALVGMHDGLSAERAYTLRTLPRGVARGLTDALSRQDPAGLGRAAAIVAGLGFTAAGFIAGTVAERLPGRDAPLEQQAA